MDIANLTRYDPEKLREHRLGFQVRMVKRKRGEYVKLEEAVEASSNSLQQVKAAIELLRWVVERVGNQTTTGEWHKWLSDADKFIADNGGY